VTGRWCSAGRLGLLELPGERAGLGVDLLRDVLVDRLDVAATWLAMFVA